MANEENNIGGAVPGPHVGLAVHKTAEGKVFGIVGQAISSDEGKVYIKKELDTRNAGWGEITSQFLTPTPTPTATKTPVPTRPIITTPTISSTRGTPTPTPTPTLTTFVAPTPTPTPTLTNTPPPTTTTTSAPTTTTTSSGTTTTSAPTTTTTAGPTTTTTPYPIGASVSWTVQSPVSNSTGGGYVAGDTLNASYSVVNQAHAVSITVQQRSGNPDPSTGTPGALPVTAITGYYQLRIQVLYDDARTYDSGWTSTITVAGFDRPSASVNPSTVTKGNNTGSTITISEGTASLTTITSWGVDGAYNIESNTQNSWDWVIESNLPTPGTYTLNPFKRLANGRTIYGTSITVTVLANTKYVGYTLDTSGYIKFEYKDQNGVTQPAVEMFGSPLQTVWPSGTCASSVTLLAGGSGASVALTQYSC